MNESAWHPPAGGWSMEPQPIILPAVDSPAPTRTKTPRWIRAWNSGARKEARILARLVARGVVHAERTPPLLHNGKAAR